MSEVIIEATHCRIGDLAVLLRHIEVHADQDAFAFEIEVRDG